MKYKIAIILLFVFSCRNKKVDTFEAQYEWYPLKVMASAYNSVSSQTDNNPSIAAFGDTLKPGMKCIAVSRDLFKNGLKHNTPVKIDGFEGVYLVKDKMHSRWQNRIDIYMGTDVQAAKNWGRKKIDIEYGLPIDPGSNIPLKKQD